MKKLYILLLLLPMCCIGCKSDAKIATELKERFPNCEIRAIPDPNTYDMWLIKTPENKILYIRLDGNQDFVEHEMF